VPDLAASIAGADARGRLRRKAHRQVGRRPPVYPCGTSRGLESLRPCMPKQLVDDSRLAVLVARAIGD
jgi:hypothetical protein